MIITFIKTNATPYARFFIPANNMIHVAKINGMVSAGNPNGSNNVFNPKWIKTVKTIPSTVAKYAFIVDLKVTPKSNRC